MIQVTYCKHLTCDKCGRRGVQFTKPYAKFICGKCAKKEFATDRRTEAGVKRIKRTAA